MADRNNGKGIDKETFLQYFPLNGLLGERLFAQFDQKHTGFIDFDEFVTVLAQVCRGTNDDKIHFIFNMYKVSDDNTVTKEELSTLLNQVPKEVLAGMPSVKSKSQLAQPADDYVVDPNEETFDEVDNYTNHDLVERCFEECDLNHEGRLTYEEFKMWIERNPTIMEHIISYFPLLDHHTENETLPHLKRVGSRPSMIASESRRNSINISSKTGRPSSASNSDLGLAPLSLHRELSSGSSTRSRTLSGSNNDNMSVSDPEELCRAYLIQAYETSQNESVKSEINKILGAMPGGAIYHIGDQAYTENELPVFKGYLWKRGKGILHLWSKRFYILHENCMFYYNHDPEKQVDKRPKGVIFLPGSLIEPVSDPNNEMKGYYGFELLHQDLCTGEHHRHEQRILYCKSSNEREMWIRALQRSAHVVPIEDEYVIGKELGHGRFSTVRECVHKTTGSHFAVKIIDKSTIEPEEKSLLRTEIAVLKLVKHPNIICMEGLYENKKYIYIVMELLKGGELFERIVGRPRFTEAEAAKLIRPLLESVAYLHDLGIVHRDLKPENILCGDELEDLKIADFGLSKMVLPKEKMDAACGTLSYVAPEVLTMQGYGMEADLWSVGVIMFLLLCGKLPFDGDNSNEIIRSTIQGEFKVNQAIWSKLSDDSKDLMTKFLNKNPKERCSAREALKHSFFTIHHPHPHKHRQSVSNDTLLPCNLDNTTPSSSPSSSPLPSAFDDSGSDSGAESKSFKPIGGNNN